MNQSQKTTTWKLLIEGEVQGVGYRRFAQKVAERRGLTGWTRNLPDGRVEVRVNAAPEQLEALVQELRKGPMHGEVTGIEVSETESEVFGGFEIRRD